MTTRPDQPQPNGKPLGEEQLLDWIEGRLPASEAARLEAVSGRAGLSTRVHQMQANRRALTALGQETAPAGLHDRVMAALERDALLGLTEEAGSASGPPISFADHVHVQRSSRLTRSAPGLALAAGLALLVGGAVYWGSLMLKGMGTNNLSPTTEVAKSDAAAGATGPVAANEMVRTETTAPIDTMLAAAPEIEEPPAGPPAPLTPDRIAHLASEGRVVLRVAASDMGALSQIEAAGSRSSGRGWRLSKDVPPEAALALLPARAEKSELMFASANSPRFMNALTPLVGPRSALSGPGAGDPLSRVRGAYMLESEADGLEAVTAMFADKLGAEVAFEELPHPVEIARAPDAADVLWWTQSPQNWSSRISVPVIVERR